MSPIRNGGYKDPYNIFIPKWEQDSLLLGHGIKLLNTKTSVITPKSTLCCQDGLFSQGAKWSESGCLKTVPTLEKVLKCWGETLSPRGACLERPRSSCAPE